MKDVYDDFQWAKVDGSLEMKVGELRLGSMKLPMVRCQPNIFATPALRLAAGPLQEMVGAGVNAAYLYSCPIKSELSPVVINDGMIRYCRQTYRHYYIDCSESFEAYEKTLNSKSLSSIRRKLRKVDKSNNAVDSLRVYTEEETIDEFFDLALPISLNSYQHRLFNTGLPIENEFKEKIKKAARENRVRGYILFVEDQPAAYNLCPIDSNGVMLYDFTGYEERFSRYSPGLVLQYSIIKSAFVDEAISIYDLCTGEGQHKSTLTTQFKICANVYFMRLTCRNYLGMAAARFFDVTTEFAKCVLERFELKDMLKKAFRKKH